MAGCCPLRVTSGHMQCTSACLLYPRKRTFAAHSSVSALGPTVDIRLCPKAKSATWARPLGALRFCGRRCEIMRGTRQAVRCRGSFHQEGSVATRPPGGIKRNRGADDITTPDFQLAPDAIPGIADAIVKIWTGAAGTDKIMERTNPGPNGVATQAARDQATALINAAAPKYNFLRCVIISESEHDRGYRMENENDVVFVLPNPGRINPAGGNLLNSAKLLMACTPNGI